MIAVGEAVPDFDLEVTTTEGGETKKLSDILGNGPAVLVGMPGAFTPTCTDRHLPGYYDRAEAFANLGVKNINIVTANDKWVNVAWQQRLEECMGSGTSEGSASVQMIADPRGEFLEAIDMIAYLGKEMGVRSKRFALIVDDGIVKHSAVDAGSEDLQQTTAEEVLSANFFNELKAETAKTCEQQVAAEIFSMSAVDALAYVQAETTRAKLANGFVDEATIDEVVAVLETASAVSNIRSAAEQQVAAAIFGMSAVDAFNFVASPSTMSLLAGAGVPKGEVDACLAILKSAVPAEESAILANVAAYQPGKGSGGVSEGPGAGGVIGGVVVALAIAGAVAAQQGLIDVSSLTSQVQDAASIGANTLVDTSS